MSSSTPFPTTEAEVEDRLSRPTPGSIQAMRELDGDLLILGVGGKMGPSLAKLARRSADEAGLAGLRVIGVSRFSSGGLRQELNAAGIETIACDLLDEMARRELPRVPNVLFMMGHKFSATDGPSMYWAMNTWLPGILAEQYRNSRIVCFSSGNVYPFTPVADPQPTEQTSCSPVGEYAITAFGRERMMEYVSERYKTPVCLLRLNYAVEPRYGVLIDLGQQILAGKTIDLATPYVNFVWQGYANMVGLRGFTLARSPAEILNLTGVGKVRVRTLAEELGRRLGVEPKFQEPEGGTALLNDSSRCHKLFGLPDMQNDELLDWTAEWLRAGGKTLGKPTKFQVRDGKF